MYKFDTKVEFKSYGLYSEVAKQLKEENHKTTMTIDQIDAVYSWYIKNIIKGLVSDYSLQANLKGLGKIKFHDKKGVSRLNYYQKRIISLLDYYEKVLDRFNKAPEEDRPHLHNKLRIMSILANKKYNILESLGNEYINRLEKYYSKGSISERNYHYFKDRYIKFKENQSELYEPIQRIFSTYEEGTKKY
jgi:hypothetical protein